MSDAATSSFIPRPTPEWPEADWVTADNRVHLPGDDGCYRAMKPALDLVAAAALLIPALPLIALSWLAVRLTSRGPGFYLQTRQGRNGRPYRILKIRTMRHDAEARSGAQWSPGDKDRRVFR